MAATSSIQVAESPNLEGEAFSHVVPVLALVVVPTVEVRECEAGEYGRHGTPDDDR